MLEGIGVTITSGCQQPVAWVVRKHRDRAGAHTSLVPRFSGGSYFERLHTSELESNLHGYTPTA